MKFRSGHSKYFIALIPPQPIYDSILEWKNYFKVEFNSKAALNSPPHITLHMPFEWKISREDELFDTMNQFASQQKSIEVQLKNFRCFPPRVIYIQVVENNHLQEMQSTLSRFCKTELNLFNANRLNKPYHPHITVAFRDLKKPVFAKAWNSVKDLEFSSHFTVRELSLLKHNGKVWEVLPGLSFALNPE